MDTQRRRHFVDAYTHILLDAWSSESYTRRLRTDPVGSVAEHGLQVPPGATVVVLEAIAAGGPEPSLDAAIETWLAGDETGVYILNVPATPQMHADALDDDALATVAGGHAINQCCCTPCCCCM